MAAQIATPFTGIDDYLRWAKKQGCTIQTGYVSEPDGMASNTVVTAPSKKFVIIHDVALGEYIPGYEFDYYSRRLGLKPE